MGFGVAVAQAVQPEYIVPAWGLDGGMLHIRSIFNGIALPPQGGEEGVKGKALPNGRVNVLHDPGHHDFSPLFFRCPLGIMFSVALRLNDRQAALPAYLVGRAAQIPKITLEVAAVFLPVHKGNGIENDVTVEMRPVNMGRHNNLVLVPQQTAGKFHPGGVGLIRRYLAGGVGMDDMVAQNAALFVPAPLGGAHIRQGGVRVAVDACDKLVRLVRVLRIGQRGGEAGLFLVQHIVNAVIHAPVQGDDFVVGQLQRLLYRAPRLPD